MDTIVAAYAAALKVQYPDVATREAEVYPLEICVDGNPNKRVIFLPEYVEANINGMIVLA